MTDRSPYDGQPFYCALCGLGFNEMMACEEGDCRMEAAAVAEDRAKRKRNISGDAKHFLPKD